MVKVSEILDEKACTDPTGLARTAEHSDQVTNDYFYHSTMKH